MDSKLSKKSKITCQNQKSMTLSFEQHEQVNPIHYCYHWCLHCLHHADCHILALIV